MPYLSVCVPTMRVGGLDVLFHGLRGQTFKDFELIVADGVRGSRPNLIAAAKASGFQYAFWKTVVGEPEPNPFPVNSFCKYANTALDAASGEVVVFLTDYTWLAPDCLQKHADFHRSHGPGDGYMAPHQYVAAPSLHPDFPRYAPGDIEVHGEVPDTERYAEDVLSGRLSQFGWSVFEKPFDQDPRSMPLCPQQANQDPKLRLPPGPVDQYNFHGKNESVRAEVAKRVRWNEALDGSHGWQDSDMARELALQWTLDPGNVAWIVNPRPHFPFARRTRPIWDNRALFERGCR